MQICSPPRRIQPFGVRNVTQVILSVVLLLVLAACSSSQNPEDIATQVAQEWVETNSDRAAEEIVKFVIGDKFIVTELAAEVLEQEISDTMMWTYSTPQQEGADKYGLNATANVEAVLPIPIVGDKTYTTSLPFNLTVDTRGKRVTNWKPLLSEASVEEN